MLVRWPCGKSPSRPRSVISGGRVSHRSLAERGTHRRAPGGSNPSPALMSTPLGSRVRARDDARLAAADSTPSARCSSSRGRPADAAAARHRGRAAPDGPPRARRVRTGCASRCQPGQVQPWRATWASTVRFASRRQALVRRIGWSGVRRKRFAKPGRPQRSQRRSFVVGQPQAPAWPSQPRQAQTRERAIHPQPTSSSGATWWRQERSVRSQAVARATGSCRSSRARRISLTTSG